MPTDLASLRQSYSRASLSEDTAESDPFRFFARWLGEALAAGITEPNAMTLATADAEGRPSARVVLLKGLDERGLVFYTNTESRKGRNLAGNPHAALAFWWAPLERQVRVEGTVEPVSAAEADAYFASRPRGSRLGAWASEQSRPVPSREALEERLRALEEEYPSEAVPRPPHWGGYRVVPTLFEFWQGRPNRLHDRLQYTRSGEGWRIDRLAP